MKKVLLVSCIAISFVCLAKEPEFTWFKQKESGEQYVLGLVGRVIYTKIGKSHNPLSQDENQAPSEYASDQSMFDKFKKCYFGTVGRPGNLRLERSLDGEELFLCGRNKEVFRKFLEAGLKAEQNFLRDRGKELREAPLQFHGENSAPKIAYEDENGQVKESSSAAIKPGGMGMLSVPSTALSTNIKDGAQVSDQELGYMARELMIRDGDGIIKDPNGRYAIKKTELTEEGGAINLADLIATLDEDNAVEKKADVKEQNNGLLDKIKGWFS